MVQMGPFKGETKFTVTGPYIGFLDMPTHGQRIHMICLVCQKSIKRAVDSSFFVWSSTKVFMISFPGNVYIEKF